MKKVIALLLALVMIFAMAGCGSTSNEEAQSAEWPTQNVRIIVPFDAGGSTDLIFRSLADQLTEDLGVTFYVDNVAGGSGSIGLAEAGLAEPDGYTLGIGMGSNMCMVPNTSDTGYDAFSFTPIAQVTNSPVLLGVSAASGIETLEQFIEYAKANRITWTSSGVANTQQVVLTLLAEQAGFDQFDAVPQDGAGSACAQVIGGLIDCVLVNAPDARSSYESGEINWICCFDTQRCELFPTVPCSAELGYDIGYGIWYSFVGPKGMDPAVVEKLDAATKAAMESERCVEAFEKLSAITQYLNHDELAAKIADFDATMDEVMAKW